MGAPSLRHLTLGAPDGVCSRPTPARCPQFGRSRIVDPPPPVELPVELDVDEVTVGTFVDPGEDLGGADPGAVALLRWRHAIREWAAGAGVVFSTLVAAGQWPQDAPPPGPARGGRADRSDAGEAI